MSVIRDAAISEFEEVSRNEVDRLSVTSGVSETAREWLVNERRRDRF